MIKHLKKIFLISLCVLNFNCENITSTSKPSEEVKLQTPIKVTEKDISNIKYTAYGLSDLAEKKTQNWLKLQELNTQIIVLKKGDLSFFNDENELLTTFFTELKTEIPNGLKARAIESRITALETVAFKLEGASKLVKLDKSTLINYIKDVLEAHSNLIFQINKKLEQDSQNIEKP